MRAVGGGGGRGVCTWAAFALGFVSSARQECDHAVDVVGEQLEPPVCHNATAQSLPCWVARSLPATPVCHSFDHATCTPGKPLPLRRAKFQEALAWQPPPGELVLRQQCALLAALCGAGGGDGANELATQALQLLQGGSTMLGLQLLTALAQEAEDLDRVRRLALVNVLSPRGREVLGALGALLAAAAQQLQQDGGGELPGGGTCLLVVGMLPLGYSSRHCSKRVRLPFNHVTQPSARPCPSHVQAGRRCRPSLPSSAARRGWS